MRKTFPAPGHIYPDRDTEQVVFDSILSEGESVTIRFTAAPGESIRIMAFRFIGKSGFRAEVVK